MRPVEFTTESIIQAGLDLQAAARNVTGFALRQRVGGGNPSRLKQVWDEHLSTQAVTRAEPVADLPIEVAEEVAAVTKALAERLAALAIELNDKAVKAAERRVSEVVRAAGEHRAQSERELADASQTVDDLETKLDQGQEAVDALEKRIADLQASSQVQAVELAQVRERLASAEQMAKTTGERHHQEAETLRAELARQKKETHAAIAERDAARKEASAAREDAATTRGQVQAMQTHSAELMRALENRQFANSPDPKPSK
jgi:colicin import membrane protein